jgi:acetyltransferase
MRPVTGLNATFANTIARPGNVGFLSQSGALLTAILDWSLRENVGFSAFVSTGSMLDVGWGDLIYYLGDDPHTRCILIYMESIGDARSFLSAAREVALQKPIIVIKSGRSAEAARAAASHTGSLAGSDAVLSAAFRRTGVLRVDSIADLFYMAEVLAKQPRPKGPRLAIVTNAGGPGVLATDALVQGGGELAGLSGDTLGALDAFLPPHWSRANPVDILGDADDARFGETLKAVAADPNNDGLLVTMVPVGVADPIRVAEQVKPYARLGDKPVLASWMGGAHMLAGESILNQAGIPTFAFPDTAARVFNYMWQFSYNLRGLYETPSLPEDEDGLPDRAAAAAVLDAARAQGRTLLTELEAKQLLATYGIATVETRLADSADAAVAHAEALGYPDVLKLHSTTITHKTDVGGVLLNLKNEAAVREGFAEIRRSLEERGQPEAFDGVTVQPMVRLDGYEVILGSSLDAQFGPVLLFGSGGSLVEVYQDRALGLPPLNTTLARRMMEQTKIYTALQCVRGRAPVDLAALEVLMVRFSQLVVEWPAIREIDINPLLVSPGGLTALDARVVLNDPEVPAASIPKLAIRPYPRQYVEAWTTPGGEPLTIRPIRPEDEPLMVAFHQGLSEQSVYMRFAGLMGVDQRVAHQRLSRICFNDYDRELALVAEREHEGKPEIAAVVRLLKLYGTEDGEFALLVHDDYQGQGIGSYLLSRIIEIGRKEGLKRIVADSSA